MTSAEIIPQDIVQSELFPEEQCVNIFQELNSRILLHKIVSAASIIRGEEVSKSDPLSRYLLLPTPWDQRYNNCFLQCLFWFSLAFKVSESKISVAKILFEELPVSVFEKVGKLSFKPKVIGLSEDEIRELGILSTNLSDHFFWRIEDEPEVIELVQTPLRVLLDIMSRMYVTAHQLKSTSGNAASVERGSKLHVYHRPYSDSPLIALVEAVHFYFHDFDFGPIRGSNDWQTETTYRAINIVAKPPLTTKVINLHRELSQELLASF